MRPSRDLRDLAKLFSLRRSVKEMERFLEDMLTIGEIEDLAERWRVVRALASGMTQRDIAKKYKVSISKITRGSHGL